MVKKKKNPKKPMQVWKLYKAEGGKVSRANKFCPKCGGGHFMGKHKDREVCGKCGYSEISKKE
tara:strand:- start:113 stop:301 length:189 start_codon:yes stop_codon:yes gene_type:complete